MRLTWCKEPMQGNVAYLPAVFVHMEWCIHMRASMLRCFICVLSVPEIQGFSNKFILNFWQPIVICNYIPIEKFLAFFLWAQKYLLISVAIKELQ
jgi:hypothetical protein